MSWFDYRLTPPELEQTYRRARVDEARRQVGSAGRFAFGLLVVFLPLDGILLSDSPTSLIAVSISRILSIIALLLLMQGLKDIARWEVLARRVKIVGAVLIGHILLLLATTALPLFAAVGILLLAVSVIYTLLPLELTTQNLLVGVLSVVGTALTIYSHPAENSLYRFATPGILLGSAIIVGLIGNLQMRRSRRQLFAAHEETRAARGQLEKVVAERDETILTKNRLFALISHELRSPVGTMISLGEMMTTPRLRLDPDRQAMLLRRLTTSARQTYLLLDNLLQWARSETGEFPADPAPVDAVQMARNTLFTFETAAQQKRLNLKLEAPEPLTVWADPRMLQCILRNLVHNAIKFTAPEDTIEIRVTAVESASTGAAVRLEVVDDGPGFSPTELHQHLRRPRLSNEVSEKWQWSSHLGLQLCHHFAELHGTTLEVESEPGAGARFSLLFPRSDLNPLPMPGF